MSRILLGVSGGIAAYKALELVRLASAAGHAVRVVQTPSSLRFVGRASFEALTGAPVLVEEFERDPMRGAFPDQPLPEHEPISHLQLVANADVLIVAPASANTIAKLAAGLADNLLTSCALAARCPLVVAPAMNNHMYEHAATQANLQTLRARGAEVVDPGEGALASRGEHGIGRLAEPPLLLAACEQAIAARGGSALHMQHAAVDGTAAPRAADPLRAEEPSSEPSRGGAAASSADRLAGLRVLVTAGGTREPIDSVRYIGNSSSGRMGMALAGAAARRGAKVTVVAANVALPAPAGVTVVPVSTAAELGAACERDFPACDVLLMAAAVADFAPAEPRQEKIKKQARDQLELRLVPTPDVIAGLAASRRAGQTLVGFAAEHGAVAVENARGKLRAKGLDAVVVNDISRSDIGFDAFENEVTILTAGNGNGAVGEQHVPRAAKELVAEAILDAVEGLRGPG